MIRLYRITFLLFISLVFVSTNVFAQLVATATVTKNVSCFGGDDGEITVDITGGTPGFTVDLTYFISGFGDVPVGSVVVAGASPQSIIFNKTTNVAWAGGGIIAADGATTEYRVQLTSADAFPFNSLEIKPIVVSEPPVLDFNPGTTTTADCDNLGSGTITIQANGGTAPYTINYVSGTTNFGSDIIGVDGGTVVFNSIAADTYEVQIVDAKSCTLNKNDIVVATGPNAGTDGASTVCSSDGNVDLFAELGGGPDAGGAWVWTNDNASGALTGDQFDPVVSGAGVFNFTYTVSVAGCADDVSNVAITVETASLAPTSAEVDGNASLTYCDNAVPGSFDLTALGGSVGTGGTIQWYTDAGFTASAGSGSPLTINSPPITTATYYVRYEGGCGGATTGQSVTVTVDVSSVMPTSATASAPLYCDDAIPGTIDLTAVGGTIGTGATVEWYTNPVFSVNIGSGNPLTIAAPVSNQTYYVRYEGGSCGVTTSHQSVSVVVQVASVAPTSATVSNNNYCFDTRPVSITLDALGGSLGDGAAIEWYTDATFSTSAGTGTPSLSIASPLVTTTYYVRYEGTCNNTTGQNVTVTVDIAPNTGLAVTAATDPICETGSTSIDVALSEVGVSYQLRNDTGDVNIGAPVAGDGNTINLPTGALAAATTFNVLATSGLCAPVELATTVAVTVNAAPNAGLAVTAASDPICEGGSTTIDVALSENGFSYQLRNNTGDVYIGAPVAGDGNMINLPTGVLTAATTFNVLVTNGACSVELAATVMVTVDASPNTGLAITAASGPICAGGSTTIDVALSENGYSYQLRNDAGDVNIGAPIAGDGNTINLPTGVLAATTTFNVLVTNGTCSVELATTVMVTVDASPNTGLAITAALDPICAGGSTTIDVALSENGYSYQLRNDTGDVNIGAPIAGDGNTINLPTGVLAATTTFNVLVTNGTCSVELATTVTVTVGAASVAPTSAIVDVPTYCDDAIPGNINLTAVGGTVGSGATVEWYTNPIFTASAGSGSPLMIVAPGSTTTYYVRYEGGCGGGNTSHQSVTVTVDAASVAPTSATSSTTSYCDDAIPVNIDLTAVGGSLGSGATVEWYTDAGFTTSTGSGSPLTIAGPLATTTYFVRYEGGCAAAPTADQSVTVTVDAVSVAPTGATVDVPTYCDDAVPANINLTALGGTVGSATVEWYTNPIFTTSAGSGSPLMIVAPGATTTYYVRYEGGCGGGNTSHQSVTVTVDAASVAPTSATSSTSSYCDDAIPVNIDLTAVGGSLGSGSTVEWYTDAGFTTSAGSGSPLTIAGPLATTTYFVRYEGGCAAAPTADQSVTVTVDASTVAPTSATVDVPTYCDDAVPANINLTAVGGTVGSATVEWYTNPTFTASAGSGSPLMIAAPVATTTYYVRYEGGCGGGNTSHQSVTVTVDAASVAPTSATSSTSSYCDDAIPVNIDLTAVGGSVGSGATVEWYTNPTFTAAAGSGSPLAIAAPIATTTYYVRYEGGCAVLPTSHQSVTVTVDAASVAPTNATVSLANYCADAPPVSIDLTAVGGIIGSAATVEWYTDAGFITSAGSGSPLTLNPAPVVTTTYYVRYEGACNTTADQSVTVTVEALPDVAITGSNAVCENITSIYSVPDAGVGATYTWTINGTGSFSGETTKDLSVDWGIINGDVQVDIVGANTCSNSSAVFAVTVSAASSPPNSSNDIALDVCQDSALPALDANSSGGAISVNWYSDNTLLSQIGTGNPFTPTAIDLDMATPAVTTFYVTQDLGCGESAAIAYAVTVVASPDGMITGNNSICAGTNGEVYSVPAGEISYAWTLIGGDGTINGATNINTVTVDWAATGGDLQVVITGAAPSNCVTTNTMTIVVAPAVADQTINEVDQTICENASVAVTLGGSELNVLYEILVDNVPSGNTQLGDGSANLLIGAVGAGDGLVFAGSPHTITVQGSIGGGCLTIFPDNIIVTVKDVSVAPTSATVDVLTYCKDVAPATINLTAVGGSIGTGATIVWYTDPTFTTSAGSGSPLNIASPVVTTTYYVRYEGGGCGDTASENVTVTVDDLSVAPTSATSSTINYCDDAIPVSIDLTAVGGTLGAGATAEWYTDPTFATSAGSGSPLNIAAPIVTTTYYVRYEGSCNTTTHQSVIVTVDAISVAPISATVSLANYCENTPPVSIDLTAVGGTVGSGATIEWYTDAGFTTSVGSGSPLTLNPAPVITTTYFVRYVGTCNTTSDQSVIVTVDALPDVTITGSNAVCENTTAVYSVPDAGVGATYTWTVNGSAAFSGETTKDLSVDWGAASGDVQVDVVGANTCSISSAVFAVTVSAVSSPPNSSNNITLSVCQDSAMPALDANSSASAVSVTWYSDVALTTQIGTGNPFTPTATDLDITTPGVTTFYVAQDLGCGESTAIEYEVTVDGLPDGTITGNNSICENTTGEIYSVPAGAVSYAWMLTGGDGSITSATDVNSITVDWASTGGDLQVIITGAAPSNCATISIMTVAVAPAPVDQEINEDDQTVCENATVSISLAASEANVDYELLLNNTPTGVISTGDGTANFVVGVLGAAQGLIPAGSPHTIAVQASINGGCLTISPIKTISVSVTAEPVAPTSAAVDVSSYCLDAAPNNIILTAVGGSLGTDGTVEWYSDPSFTTAAGSGSPLIISSPVVTTTYYVRYEGSCAITLAQSVDVAVQDVSVAPVADNGGEDPVMGCQNGPAPTIAVLGTSITWYSDAALNNVVSTGNSYTPAASELDMTVNGNTSFFATQDEGCGESPSVEIRILIENCSGCYTVDINSIAATCTDDDGSITLIIGAAGVSPFDYEITNTDTGDGVTQNDQPNNTFTFSGIASGNYSYLVRDATACEVTGTIDIGIEETKVTTTIEKVGDIACFGDPTGGEARITVTGGVNPYQYKVGADDWTDFNSGDPIDGLPVGEEYVILVRDSETDGCPTSSTISISEPSAITATQSKLSDTYPEQPVGSFEVTDITSDFAPFEIELLDATTGETIQDPIEITPDRFGNYDFLYEQLESGGYVAVIIDDSGCELAMGQIDIDFIDSDVAVIPNVFTPNNDGYNESFTILNKKANTKLVVVNRWGVKVYKSDDYKNDWGAEGVPDAIYFYTINMDGQVYNGSVEVWRGGAKIND